MSLLLLYFSAAVSLNDELNMVALYGAIPLAFTLSCICSGFQFFKNKYMLILIVMYLWVAFTALGSIDMTRTLRQFNQILGVLLLCFTICNLAKNPKTLPWLYGIYIVIAIAMWIYVKDNLLTTTYDISNSRLGDDTLNTNKIAYFTCFVTCSLYMFGLFYTKTTWRAFLRALFLVMIPATYFIAFYTASRQVFIIQIPLISLLIYFRYLNGQKFKIRNVTIIILAILAVIIVFGDQMIDYYDHSFLKERSETNIEHDSRTKLISQAFEVGIQNPIAGVGPGCFAAIQSGHYFSHCSYTELFANSGILAVVLFCWAIFGFIVNSYQSFRLSHKNVFGIMSVIGLIYAFYNIFYVFYIDLWLMSFFALITSQYLIIKKQYLANQ